MGTILRRIVLTEGPHVSISVTYTAVLNVKWSTAEHLARLLHDHRIAAGIRRGRRALGCFRQAVLFPRWFIDGTRLAQLACDNGLEADPLEWTP
ncbi:hypothetical protein GCM10009574_099340 [Streptomyces asiaticus]|uniref:Uncharacterized protein n=2 Tax=Streptomyces rhizosphaericus TaxID=114699 RepID=A0ABP4DBL0_9ACTN